MAIRFAEDQGTLPSPSTMTQGLACSDRPHRRFRLVDMASAIVCHRDPRCPGCNTAGRGIGTVLGQDIAANGAGGPGRAWCHRPARGCSGAKVRRDRRERRATPC